MTTKPEEVESVESVVPDPFLDDRFAPLDTRTGPSHIAELGRIAEENPEFAPVEDPGEPAPAPVPAPAPAPEEPEPVAYEFQDGSSVTIEKTKSRGWKATCSTGAAGAKDEVFYGNTKDELLTNLAAAKINATKKIRQMTRAEKLRAEEPAPATPAPQVRALSADEKFAIKSQLESDPDLAMESWFQKKTGMSLDQLVQLAAQGNQAKLELEAESVAKAFMGANPDYYATRDNYVSVLALLAKTKLRVTLTDRNEDEVMNKLVTGGFWTVKNLEDAKEELLQDGLLDVAPTASEDEEEEPTPAPAPPAPAPAAVLPQPADERIVRTVRRPRAGLGIRPTANTAVAPQSAPDRSPSVEDYENMRDEDVVKLFSDVRRHKLSQGRR